MKIRYEFANGEVTEVEVSEEVGAVIIESRKAEHAQQEKQRYHCYSYDAIDFEGVEYADPKTPESLYEEDEDKKKIELALSTLTPAQRRRILMLADGMSVREIARYEGSDHKSVLESINRAKKKIKNFFLKTPPQNTPFFCV